MSNVEQKSKERKSEFPTRLKLQNVLKFFFSQKKLLYFSNIHNLTEIIFFRVAKEIFTPGTIGKFFLSISHYFQLFIFNFPIAGMQSGSDYKAKPKCGAKGTLGKPCGNSR